MKNLLFKDHQVKNRSFRAECSEIIEFHDVLIVLNLEDVLKTIKSLFQKYNNRNNNNNNYYYYYYYHYYYFRNKLFYNKIKILTKLH